MRHFNACYLAAVCLLAGARVFLGAAAMPPFNDVDEEQHLDLIHKFARGYWPREKVAKFDAATARLGAYYGCPEFRARPQGLFRKPVWSWPVGPRVPHGVLDGRASSASPSGAGRRDHRKISTS